MSYFTVFKYVLMQTYISRIENPLVLGWDSNLRQSQGTSHLAYMPLV